MQRALSERLGSRKVTLAAFDEANEPLAADLSRLYAERDSLSGGHPDGPTEAQSVDALRERWDAGRVADKRAMLADAPGRDRLVIDAYNRLFRNGKKAFDESRIRVEPATSTPAPADAG